jgi:pyruvate formate lyase activating enzyme
MPGYVEVEDIHILGNMLQRENTWVLQQFVPEHAMDQKAQQIRPHTRIRMLELQRTAQEYVGNTALRGI